MGSVNPEQIRWYLDGVNFFTVNANQVDATTWNNATHHGFFVILNVAMGGGFPAAFGGGRNAYATIQAESYNQQSGARTEATSDSGGGQNIGWIANGDWALYSSVDFGSTPARQFS